MKLVTIALAAFLIVLAFGQTAGAQTLTLTVTPTSFSFGSGDPDTTPEVASPMVTVGFRTQSMGGKNPLAWHLAMHATTDLTSGSDTIPVANIRWTATAPLSSGAALSTSDQTLASGIGNTATTYSTVTFYLKNLWTYKVGTYSTTIVFTLSSP